MCEIHSGPADLANTFRYSNHDLTVVAMCMTALRALPARSHPRCCNSITESLNSQACLFACVVGRASERARLDVFESHRHSDLVPAFEFLGSDVTLDG